MSEPDRTLPHAGAWELMQLILDEALSIPEVEHAEFVRRRCADDSRLRSEVESLLASFKDGEEGLAPSDFALDDIADDQTNLPADYFPGYQLFSEIRRGGQLNTLEDMLRRGERWSRLSKELALRFGHLHADQFAPHLNERAQADLDRMIALDYFFRD